MKFVGLLLLPAGWAIVISAIVMFSQPVSRWTFVLAGLTIQGVGLVLTFLGSRRPREIDS
jgi:hypothetical protein